VLPARFQRKTRQRQVILEELCRTAVHPTAGQLYEHVRRRLPRISLGTIYRNLDLLVRMGKIAALETSGSETRFDGNPLPHDHLRCTVCGRIDDLAGPPLDTSAAGRDFGGYEILGHRLEFVGVCPGCREQKS
jgi:Fur family ferric uptake transcriptional regulator